MISTILLSAGLSERFGAPKALAELQGQTVIERLQKMLIVTQVDEIIVVLGAWADQIKPYLLNHKKVKFVYNKDYNFGQTSSFKTGIKGISRDAQGVILLPIDYPGIQEKTISALIGRFLEERPLIVVPSLNGKKGHPPLFSCDLRNEFLSLDNTAGLNSVIHAHKSETIILPVEDPGVIQTFNTAEEFERIKSDLFQNNN